MALADVAPAQAEQFAAPHAAHGDKAPGDAKAVRFNRGEECVELAHAPGARRAPRDLRFLLDVGRGVARDELVPHRAIERLVQDVVDEPDRARAKPLLVEGGVQPLEMRGAYLLQWHRPERRSRMTYGALVSRDREARVFVQ